MTPPTSNTTRRGPGAMSACASEPGPAAARVVTRISLPPRPPTVPAAQPLAHSQAPLADGSADAAAGARLEVCPPPAGAHAKARLARITGRVFVTPRYPARPPIDHGAARAQNA